MDVKVNNYPSDAYASRPEYNPQPPPYSGPQYTSAPDFPGIFKDLTFLLGIENI